MKQAIMIAAALAGVVSAGGCASHSRTYAGAQGGSMALMVMGPNGSSEASVGPLALGAGDALGQALYTNYVEYVRANGDRDWNYATGAEN